VVPGRIGSDVDVFARVLRLAAKENGGRQIELVNRSDSASAVAADFAAKTPPDGNTVLLITATIAAINPHIAPASSIDTLNLLDPVTAFGEGPYVLVVPKILPPTSVAALIEYAKAKPRKIEYLSDGAGKLNHLAGELFKSMTGTQLLHTPYVPRFPPGLTPIKDLVSGTGDLIMFARPYDVTPQIKSDKVRLLAVTTLKRSPQYPDVPTLAESGLNDFYVAEWGGAVMPRGAAAADIQALAAGLGALMFSQEKRLRSFGLDPVSTSPAEFAEFIRAERQRYGQLIKAGAIRIGG
jgi:tripartite-type tricarboxylate transporter receptor subunit TctC